MVARSDLVLDCLPRAIVVTDLAGTVLAWNRVAERLYGWTAAEVVGRPAFQLLLAAISEEDAHRIFALVEAGEAWRGDVTVTRRDGGVTKAFSFVGPLRDEAGRVVGLVSAADDLDDVRHFEQRAADLSEHLVLALAAGELGTWRWDMATGVTVWDATMERLFGLEPGKLRRDVRCLGGTAAPRRRRPDAGDARAGAGRPAALRGRAPGHLAGRQRPLAQGRGKVTLDADGNVSGTIGCTGDESVRKVLEIESARRAREAEQVADRERLQRERLEFLAALNDAALGRRRPPSAHARRHRGRCPPPGRLVRAPLPPCCRRHPRVRGRAPRSGQGPLGPGSSRSASRSTPTPPTGVPAVIRTGRMEFIRDVDEAFLSSAIEAAADLAPPDELRAIVDVLQLASVITVPLRTKRGVVGAIQFVSAESGRHYDNEDVTLAQAAAGRVAEALDAAWMTEQHKKIATTLQSALLPPRLPDIDGVSLAVRYWAAGAVSEVGGDFYDVFPIDDGRWAIVIGDVCGTGPNAAAVTAIARHTIRAAAMHGASHAEVLDWANLALHAGNRDLFCTVVFSTLERGEGGTWRYTCTAGGHPLPLLVRGGGRAATVGRPGTLLGVVGSLQTSTVGTDLGRGDTLVLYTDGVTDLAPPHHIEPDALAALVAEAATGAESAEEVAGRLGAAIHAQVPIPDRTDDVALIVVRITEG